MLNKFSAVSIVGGSPGLNILNTSNKASSLDLALSSCIVFLIYDPISILSALMMSILLILLSLINSINGSSISYPASKYILPVFSSIISEDKYKPINDSSFIARFVIFFFYKSLIISSLTFVPFDKIILPFLLSSMS